MAKCLFWNVQRLGERTPEDRKLMFEGVVAQYFKEGGDIVILCEVTSNFDLDGSLIEKTGEVQKRSKRKTNAQLGYAAFNKQLENLHLTIADVSDHDEVNGEVIQIRGGNKFDKQSKRHVVRLTGSNIYAYHSNASYKSKYLVPWVANSLDSQHPHFVLVGDMNINPQIIQERLSRTTEIRHDGATHGDNIYDYAIGKGYTVMQVKKYNSQEFARESGLEHSDHQPIAVTFV